MKRHEKYIGCCFLFLLSCSVYSQKIRKPVLTKLPFAFSQLNRTPMENTPVNFNGRLLLVANYRPGGAKAKGEDAYLYIDDLVNGEEIARFGKGYTFVSAFVSGSELHVFALDFSDFGEVIKSKRITHFVSRDLKEWKEETAIEPAGDEALFNTSVCKDDQGYLMAYESNKPVQFCFKFARSNDLKTWDKIPEIVFTGEHKEYSACPMIRFIKPYYYVIYLHAKVSGHNGWVSFMARSKNLADWELGSYNPVLEAGEGEGKNNSDVDIIEYQGKTYLYYGIGDQETWSTIRVALYDGPMREFYESYFPEGVKRIKVSARQ